jgi:hypothetical protein
MRKVSTESVVGRVVAVMMQLLGFFDAPELFRGVVHTDESVSCATDM